MTHRSWLSLGKNWGRQNSNPDLSKCDALYEKRVIILSFYQSERGAGTDVDWDLKDKPCALLAQTSFTKQAPRMWAQEKQGRNSQIIVKDVESLGNIFCWAFHVTNNGIFLSQGSMDKGKGLEETSGEGSSSS